MISICKGGRWREDERRLGDPLGSVTVVSTSFSTNLAPCTTTPWNRKHVGITMRRERRSARGLKYFLIRGIGRSFNLVKSRRRVSSAPPSLLDTNFLSSERRVSRTADVATECSARNTGVPSPSGKRVWMYEKGGSVSSRGSLPTLAIYEPQSELIAVKSGDSPRISRRC